MTTGTSPTTPHAQALRAWLDGLRRRWRVLTGLGVLARAAGAVAVVALAAWLTDWLVAPVGGRLVLFFILALVVAAAAVVMLVRPLRTPPSDRQLARLAEERDSSLEDVVVTATERLNALESGPFDRLVVKAAADRLPSIEPTTVIEGSRVSRAGRWAAVAVAVLLLSGSLAWAPTWRALQTARLYVAPPEITLTVAPGDARVVAGSPLRITARLEGLPSGASVEAPQLRLSPAGEGAGPIMMRPAGNGYFAELPQVDRGFRYRVVSGSLSSREFQVAALEPARVKRIDLEYEFPAFTKLAPRRDEDGGDIYGPAGTKVKIRVHTDKPVAGGALAVRSGEPVRLARDGAETELTGTLTLDRDGAYRVGLTDVDGLASAGDTEYFIRVMDDQPPDVRVLRPAGDRQVTRLEEIVIEAHADDDHGVASLELVYAVKGGKERAVPLHRGPKTGEGAASTSVTGAHTLYVEELDVAPGDFITYFARARDVSRGKRSTEARSDIFFLEVRPFNEEFFAAQSQAMMGGGGGAAADLLESQKEIIVATWKLQRRQIAGQSAEDVKAVGKAQGELRMRAQAMAAQMARGMPRRRGNPVPAPAPAQEENPLLRAAGAMARAETSLNALKPNDAVPHEMSAYNELLKMQAEITRRQVSRQRASGGGGGGRSGNQDLSALFDEELLRQQETNYEKRNLGGESSSNSAQQNSALDKLKELARRQDEIAQRQRELARARAALMPEEVKRQLERLTREQEELRRETEALSQQMARQQGSPQDGQSQSSESQSRAGQPQSGQPQSGQVQSGEGGQATADQRQARREGAEGSNRLKEAAEEMASAARELSQSNLDEAQARTDETLERLRDLERRLSGEAVPDERRRAMGEMQLEARQVAEAQRKLANDARRAAGTGENRGSSSVPGRGARREPQGAAPSVETMRRLAAEQQRLAERVDALERRLGNVPRTGGDQEAAKSAATARDELARQRLGVEMRKTAEAMRQSGASAPSPDGRPVPQPGAIADRADALAQAAGQVAERLGASVAGSPETRQLSDQLARLRSARERLDQAESRLRDAAQRASAEARQAGGASESRDGRSASPSPRSGQPSPGRGAEQGPSGSQRAGGSESGGQSGQGGGGGQGSAQRDLARLQHEYDRALRETRSLMDSIGRQGGDRGANGRQDGAMGTPEQHEFSRSAPGTEAFKQDYSRWDVLAKDVNNALEETEASLAQRLSERIARDRVHAGADERAPAAYADSVSRYYRSLARRPQP